MGPVRCAVWKVALFGATFLISNLSFAQTFLKSTNPITATRLEEMKLGILPSVATGHSSAVLANGRPQLPRLPQVVTSHVVSMKANPQLTAHPTAPPTSGANFGLFYTAPYVSGTPSGDTSPVYTSVSGDFDRAKGADIATVQYDGTLNILFNDGKGRLTTSYSNSSAVALGAGIVYIRQADLNGDQYPDIVAMDGTNSAFLVFLNQKDGTFANAVSTSVAPASGAAFVNGGGIAIADVNGDGHPDIVAVSNLQAGQYPNFKSAFSQQTFLGNGDGTFQAPTGADTILKGYFFVQYGEGLALADVNGDGNLDLVMEIAENDTVAATEIGFSLGDGHGGFQSVAVTAARVTQLESPQSALQVRDVNEDGNPDTLFLDFYGTVYAALGNGDGTLQPAVPVLSNLVGASFLQLGDFDGDGELDLIVYGYGRVGVFHGNADGTFNPAALGQYVGSLGGDQQPAPADFNGDGSLDFAWTESVYGKVSIFANRGKGTFVAANVIVPANVSSSYPNNTEWGYNNLTAALGDFNHDGLADVLAYDFTNAAQSGYADIDFGLSDGRGHFNYTLAMTGSSVGSSGIISVFPATGDFNGDGRSDVIFSTLPGLIVALSKADGTLQTPIPVTFPVPVGCVPVNYADVGDVNGDGHVDIVAAYAQNPNCPGSKNTQSGIFVFLGDGTGHFTGSYTPLGHFLYFISLADFNGDGHLDIGVADLDGENNYYAFYAVPGKGDGSFDVSSMQTAVSDQLVSGIVPGDYNNDGKQDLTLLTVGQVDGNGMLVPHTAGALLLPGNGDFTFGHSKLLVQDIYALTGAYGDFNNDGNMDLAVSQYSSFQDPVNNFGLIVVPGTGGGNFGVASNFLLPMFNGVGNASVFAGQFSRDGNPDIVVGGAGSSALFMDRKH